MSPQIEGTMTMLLDVHVHTSHGSPCSRFALMELVSAIRQERLPAVVITEHWRMDTNDKLKLMLTGTPCNIIAGVEISTEAGRLSGFRERREAACLFA